MTRMTVGTSTRFRAEFNGTHGWRPYIGNVRLIGVDPTKSVGAMVRSIRECWDREGRYEWRIIKRDTRVVEEEVGTVDARGLVERVEGDRRVEPDAGYGLRDANDFNCRVVKDRRRGDREVP